MEIPELRGKKISGIACGEDFSVVATRDPHQLLTFGRGDVGQHARLSSNNNSSNSGLQEFDLLVPTPVPGLLTVVATVALALSAPF